MTSLAMRLFAAIATTTGFVASAFDAHLAPTSTGWWHGVTGGPTATTIVPALAAGAFVFGIGSRIDARPFVLMLAGLFPLIPAMTGIGAGLLVFTAETLVLLFAILTAITCRDLLARMPARPRGTFAIAFAFFLLVGRFLPGAAGPQGDEPHYLLLAESLIEDHDVDLANQYRDRAFAKFTSGELEPHTAPRSPKDAAYSIHTAGLSALIAPGYAVAGCAGARAVLSLIAALSVTLIVGATSTLLGSEAGAFVFVLATFATPLPVYANSLFPDSAAILPAAAALAYLASPRTGLLVGSTIAIAALPWLHPRFLPLALVLGLAIALRDGLDLKRGAQVLLPLAVSVAALLFHFHALFGVASLSAAYGPDFSSDVSITRMPWGMWALTFDRQFGLLLLAPALMLGVAGSRALYRRHPGIAMIAVLSVLSVMGVGGSFSMWWGGASAPARFAIGATPPLLLLCAARWTETGSRRLLAGALGFGAGLLAVACNAPRALHNRDGGESGLLRLLAPDLDLDRLFPSFTIASNHDVAMGLAWTLVFVALLWRPRAGLGAALLALGLGAFNPAKPLLDPFPASLRVLESWNDRRRSFGATDRASDFELAAPLGSPDWTLRSGSVRYSSRFSLPAGNWTIRIDSVAPPIEGVLNVARVSLVTGDESRSPIVSSLIETGRRTTRVDFELSRSERRVHIKAEGLQAEAAIDAVRLAPRSLEK